MKPIALRLTPLTLFGLLALFLWRGLSLNPHEIPSTRVGQILPQFDLPQLLTHERFSSKQLQGKISLLNVWASWCNACVEEQVFLLDLAKQGFKIYGLNYKDNAQNAVKWLNEWGNPYQAIGIDNKGKVSIDLGVYGAPETFLIDKEGVIRFRHVGILTAESWQNDFLPRIRELERTSS